MTYYVRLLGLFESLECPQPLHRLFGEVLTFAFSKCHCLAKQTNERGQWSLLKCVRGRRSDRNLGCLLPLPPPPPPSISIPFFFPRRHDHESLISLLPPTFATTCTTLEFTKHSIANCSYGSQVSAAALNRKKAKVKLSVGKATSSRHRRSQKGIMGVLAEREELL